ncbi:MAG: chitobiase/beta-hexosaminidase C-terminal domain-containing protein, partial [Longimicrobiales bacterium]
APSRTMPVNQAQVEVFSNRIAQDVRKVSVAIDTVEKRLDSYSTQLAAITQLKSGEQSADLFRYALTSAAANISPLLVRKDWGQALSQALPLVQGPFSQSGRAGLTSSLQTSPISTLAFPILSLAAGLLLRRPDPPAVVQPKPGDAVQITTGALIGKIRYTTDGTNPIDSSPEYTAPIPAPAGTTIKAKVFGLFGVESDTAVIVGAPLQTAAQQIVAAVQPHIAAAIAAAVQPQIAAAIAQSQPQMYQSAPQQAQSQLIGGSYWQGPVQADAPASQQAASSTSKDTGQAAAAGKQGKGA